MALLSRSVDKDDVELLLVVERRLEVDFGMVKKVLRFWKDLRNV